jgi:hypothetical protein
MSLCDFEVTRPLEATLEHQSPGLPEVQGTFREPSNTRLVDFRQRGDDTMTQGYLGIAGEESFLYPFFNLLRVLAFPEVLSKKAFLSFSLAKLSTRDRIMKF